MLTNGLRMREEALGGVNLGLVEEILVEWVLPVDTGEKDVEGLSDSSDNDPKVAYIIHTSKILLRLI